MDWKSMTLGTLAKDMSDSFLDGGEGGGGGGRLNLVSGNVAVNVL